jgi:hypothetical protein
VELHLAAITVSALPSINQACGALLVLICTIMGTRSAAGIVAAGTMMGHRGGWDQAKDQFWGGTVGLAIAILFGTGAVNFLNVGAIF